MGRVINPETAGKERALQMRLLALAVRHLALQSEPSQEARDVAAFIALTLEGIYATVDGSVAAWEKRGYWVKADRYRMDWDWARRLGAAMRQAVLTEDWAEIAKIALAVAARVNGVKPPGRGKPLAPWAGAYQKLALNRD